MHFTLRDARDPDGGYTEAQAGDVQTLGNLEQEIAW